MHQINVSSHTDELAWLPPSAGHEGTGGPIETVDQVLRNPAKLLQQLKNRDQLAPLTRRLVFTIMAAAALFGGALGLYRGGLQVAYAAVKLPLVILLTTVICAPALTAFNRVLRRRQDTPDFGRDVVLILCGLARGSLTLAALAPLVLLGICWNWGYHLLIITAVACCAVAGLTGLRVLFAGLKGTPGQLSHALLVGSMVLVVGLVATQTTWTFRPYLVRPQTQQVPFVRSLEGSFGQSVAQSTSSALGLYDHDRREPTRRMRTSRNGTKP
jgi:hypothetical protein